MKSKIIVMIVTFLLTAIGANANDLSVNDI